MKLLKYDDMIKGWFVGGFEPTALKTQAAEIGVKKYKSGDYEESHFHKVATELTMIVSGKVQMNGKEYCEGDIVVIEPNESTDFKALTDAVNVVVKMPGALNDKYLTKERQNA